MEVLSRDFPISLREIDKENRKVTFVISTESRDSHGSVIRISAWDLNRFKKNGVVHYQHSMHSTNPDDVIGIGKAWVEGKELIGEVEFEPAEINELAEKIYKKVKFGSLTATSVGFFAKSGHWGDEKKAEDPDIFYFEKVELIEFSIVHVPANADTVKRYLDTQQREEKKEEKETIFDEYDARYLIIKNHI